MSVASLRKMAVLAFAASSLTALFAACGSGNSHGGGAADAGTPDVTAADGDTDAAGDDVAPGDELPPLTDASFPKGPDGCYLSFGPCMVDTNCCGGTCTDAGCVPPPRPP